MSDMYLGQIVAALRINGKCGGAPEPDVIRAMKTAGTSEGIAQFYIDQAVRNGALRRVWCRCN